ncbi:uncharacterized protein LOC115713851 [Cannabis sativa]|uniref:F-box domain-containing protein n=1 Tax=Cannabis sativa TaxID=3483 RepID=A0A803PG43_CANSA|nr:uncharacterized protein LOC115713851 [Cannabis sativa]
MYHRRPEIKWMFERRKKRKIDNSESEPNVFDDLPEELKIEILRRLPTKKAAILTLVSKSWFWLITTKIFPKTNPKLPFIGVVLIGNYDSRPNTTILIEALQNSDSHSVLPSNIERDRHYPFTFFTSQHKVLMNCCNGLILFSGCNESKRSFNYSYIVYNPLTNQWVDFDYVVNKPYVTAKSTMYAALAYNPSESCFYRVVQFQGFRCLNVYCSETRSWNKLRYRLPTRVSTCKTRWLKQTVFYQGALFRLSTSGHLLKFVIDKEATSIKDQAQAIDLPKFQASKHPPNSYGLNCIGLSNDQINFMAFDKELSLCIWVLSDTYEWSLRTKLSKIHEKYGMENNFCRPLAFHSYMDTVFVGAKSPHLGSLFLSLNFEKDVCSQQEDNYVIETLNLEGFQSLNWLDVAPSSFHYSHVPFANGMAKKLSLQVEEWKPEHT